MKILVTGGAGFIGSHLVDRLLSDEHTVINIDNLDSFYGRDIKLKNIENHREFKNYSFHEVDICDFSKLDQLVPNDIDAIIHLAAKAGVRPSIEDPISYQNVNVAGTQNILEIARLKNIRQFVFASSSSVYGKNPNVPWSEEDAVLQPISPYASTKVSGELLGHVYSHLYGIRFIGLRFFTVFGPRQRPDLAIHKFLKLMANGQKIVLYGKGDTRRDYTYVLDVVSGILKALTYDKTMYELVNIGNNQTITLNALIDLIEKTSNIQADRVYIEEQLGDVRQTWASLEKSKKLLNYNPEYDFETGLKGFVNWFREQN
tara:strand:+ start:3101 stop:4048 length:948 start_codon:yes stop_codon:yes gene_type:complete